jgi:hypothetical protein
LPPGGKLDFGKFKRSKDFDMLGINYRGSPIVLDERSADDNSVYEAYGNMDLEGKLHLRAGDRAPDAPGLLDVKKQTTTSLFDIFKATYHTVLIFGTDTVIKAVATAESLNRFPAEIFHIIACLSKDSEGEISKDDLMDAITVLKDCKSHAYSAYLLADQESGMFVVRPDGVLGAIIDSVEGLERYLTLVFI